MDGRVMQRKEIPGKVGQGAEAGVAAREPLEVVRGGRGAGMRMRDFANDNAGAGENESRACGAWDKRRAGMKMWAWVGVAVVVGSAAAVRGQSLGRMLDGPSPLPAPTATVSEPAAARAGTPPVAMGATAIEPGDLTGVPFSPSAGVTVTPGMPGAVGAAPVTAAPPGVSERTPGSLPVEPAAPKPPATTEPVTVGPAPGRGGSGASGSSTPELSKIERTPIGGASGTDSGAGGGGGSGGSMPSLGAGQVLAALAIVIGLIFVGRGVAKKFLPGAKGGSGKGVIEILARHPLAKNQSIVLVRIGSQIVALNQGREASQSVLVISDGMEVAKIIGQIEGRSPESMQAGFNKLLANARIDLEEDSGEEDLKSMSGEALDEQLEEMAAAKRQLMELRQHVRSVRDRLPRE